MNAHVKPDQIVAPDKRMRCIPQAHDFHGELVNVRTLLKLSRAQEALLRLELALDRGRPGWRAEGGHW